MQFTADLKDAIRKLSIAIPKKTGLNILNTVKIVAGDNKVDMTATNLETLVNVLIKCDVKKQGSVCIDYTRLSNIVNMSKYIDINADSNKAYIDNGIGQYEISTIPTTDYPAMPDINLEFIEIKSDALINAIKKISHAIGENDSKYVLSTISFNKDEIVATNGFCLSIAECDIGIDGLITKNLVNAVKIIQDDIKIGSDDKKIVIIDNDTTMIFNKVFGYYPDYKRAIPTKFESVLTCNKEQIIQSINAILIDKNNYSIELESKKNEMLIMSRTTSITAKVSIPCECNDVFRIFISHKYLLDVLNVLEGDTVAFNIVKAEDPVLTPVLIGDTTSKHIIMPLRGN